MGDRPDIAQWIETHLTNRDGSPVVLTEFQRRIARRLHLLPPMPRDPDRDKTDIRGAVGLYGIVDETHDADGSE